MSLHAPDGTRALDPILRRTTAAALRAIEASTARVLWLAGPPGAGKSRAVEHLATRPGVIAVDLHGYRHPRPAACRELGHRLGLAPAATWADLKRGLARSDRNLLVIDHLDAASPPFAKALAESIRDSGPRLLFVRRIPAGGPRLSGHDVVWMPPPDAGALPSSLGARLAPVGPWAPALVALAGELAREPALAEALSRLPISALAHRVLPRTRLRPQLRAWVGAMEREFPGLLAAHAAGAGYPPELRTAAIQAGLVGQGAAAVVPALAWWRVGERLGSSWPSPPAASMPELGVARDGRVFVLPDGKRIDVDVPRAAAPVLAALAHAARRSPRRPWLSAVVLFRAGWRGERASEPSMRARVQQVVLKLRDRGLRPWLLTSDGRFGLVGARVVLLPVTR